MAKKRKGNKEMNLGFAAIPKPRAEQKNKGNIIVSKKRIDIEKKEHISTNKNSKTLKKHPPIKKHNFEKNERTSSSDDYNSDNKSIVPIEIDTHFQLYGKHMWEIKYNERCPLCEKRIDEFGFCACSSFSD